MFFLIKKLCLFFYIDRVTENFIEGLIYMIKSLTVLKDIELLAKGSLLISFGNFIRNSKGEKREAKKYFIKGSQRILLSIILHLLS